MTIKEIRDLTGLSRPEFAKKYDIPYRTLQNWELGEREAPGYVLNLLARAVMTDKATGEFEGNKAYVFYAERLNEPIAVYSGTKEDCARYAETERNKIKSEDRATRDYYVKTVAELETGKKAREILDSLTEEEKNDIIEVNGKKYIRKIYESKEKA